MQFSNQSKAELWLVLATLIWGATFTVIQIGLNDTSPLMFLSLRFLVAFTALVLIYPKMFKKLNKQIIKIGILLGFLMFGGYGLQTLGLKYTTVAKSSLITYSFVLFVPFLQYFIIKKNLHISSIIGLIIVSLGMLLLNNPQSASFNIGDLLTFGSAIFYAFYIIGLDCLTKREPMLLTALQFLVTAVLGLVSSYFFETAHINFTADLAFCLFFLAIPGGVIAIFILNRYQNETTPTKACLLYSLEPVFAVLIGFLVLSQGLNSLEMIGTGIILAGVVISELFKTKQLIINVETK